MYGMAGVAKKLKIPNCKKTTGNCVYYMYGFSRFAEKFNIQICVNSTGNCVYYMYRWFGFAEKLNIQNSVIQRIIVYIICTKCLDLQKYWISRKS